MTIASVMRDTSHRRNGQNLFRDSVIADPETSGSIYNGEPKVIVPAGDLRTATEVWRLGGRLAIYVCERSGRRGCFEIYRAGAPRGPARIPLNHPPTFCLALLAVSPAGKRDLDGLREAWSIGAEGFLPSATCVDVTDVPDAAATVHRSLFEAIADAYGSSAARLLALRRQYAAFRIVHDQLQNAFDTVENFLSRSQLPPTWLAFACEPTETTVGPQTPDGPFRLTQLLPVPSQGLAAIELHSVAAAADASGSLAVAITTCEDARTLGEWAIPYAAVPNGWMFLDLPEIDIAPRQSVSLTAVWNTQSGKPPLLSLTSRQPVPEAQVSLVGGEESRRSLAVRLHIGLPGSRRVAHPYHIGVRHQPHISGLGHRLAPSALRGYAELDPVPGREPLVTLLDDAAAIEVRPVNGSVTIAKLPGALPAGARRLTATIKTEDPDGPLVEYALLALGPRGGYRQVLKRGRLNGEHGGFSGWLAVHPDFMTQIHLTLSEPADNPLDLYLATRLAKGQAAIGAQARWLEFVVDALDATAAA
jgi:Family of unknown function (DUF6212)